MPTLLVLATQTGKVSNVIVYDNEQYADEAEKFFALYCPSIQHKSVPFNSDTELLYRDWLNSYMPGHYRAVYAE